MIWAENPSDWGRDSRRTEHTTGAVWDGLIVSPKLELEEAETACGCLQHAPATPWRGPDGTKDGRDRGMDGVDSADGVEEAMDVRYLTRRHDGRDSRLWIRMCPATPMSKA